MPGFFDDLTVVEFADQRNQFVGKLLSDGGARVIQIEPSTGSPGRHCGPFLRDIPNPDTCLDYWFYNTGKESVCIPIDSPEGTEVARQLIRRADIVLESEPPGRMEKLGLGYASTSSVNPRVVYASITDFGQSGPFTGYRMNDVASLALGGPMGMCGYSDPKESPIACQGHQAWNITGTLCLHAIVIALIERMESGEGQYIDCAVHDCCSLCTEGAFAYWVYDHRGLYRQTAQHAAINRQAPTTFPAADGRYVLCTSGRLPTHVWVKLLAWMNEEGVAGELNEPQYRDEAYRNVRARDGHEIREALARLVAKVPADEAMHRAQSFGLAWAVVRAPEENYDEPHWRERGFFMPVEHPEFDSPVEYPGRLFRCEDAPLRPAARAPGLGEHTAAILQELGLAKEYIEQLRTHGVAQ